MFRKGLIALGLTLGIGVSSAALAQAVIVRSSGPSAASYPAGKRLAAGTVVTLRQGDMVVMIDKAGSRVLNKPGPYRIDGQITRDTTLAMQIGRSLSKPAPVRITTGATRGPGEPPPPPPEVLPPSVWLADTEEEGLIRVCVLQGSDLYLWRSNIDKRRFAWLGDSDGGSMVRLQFPENVAGVSWPVAMVPLVDGRIYRLAEEANADKVHDFEVIILDPAAVPVDAQGLATTLLDNGCRRQFEWMSKSLEVEQLAEPAPVAEGG